MFPCLLNLTCNRQIRSSKIVKISFYFEHIIWHFSVNIVVDCSTWEDRRSLCVKATITEKLQWKNWSFGSNQTENTQTWAEETGFEIWFESWGAKSSLLMVERWLLKKEKMHHLREINNYLLNILLSKMCFKALTQMTNSWQLVEVSAPKFKNSKQTKTKTKNLIEKKLK